jgi:hypothetical protein
MHKTYLFSEIADALVPGVEVKHAETGAILFCGEDGTFGVVGVDGKTHRLPKSHVDVLRKLYTGSWYAPQPLTCNRLLEVW